MFSILCSTKELSQNQSTNSVPNLSKCQNSQNVNHNHIPDTTIAATDQAVKFLSTALPTFGGTEEENVSLWLEKIETIASNHNLSSLVKLSAATAKLTKIARRWFDLSSGDINSSSDSFKTAITRKFKRRMLHSLIMQKVENRK